MTITLAGQAGIGGASDTSPQTITYTSSAGSLLAIAGHFLNAAGNPALASIEDSAGNTWYYSTGNATSQNPPQAFLNDQELATTEVLNFVAWTYQNKGPVTSVTIARADTGSNWWRVALGEFPGAGAFSSGAADAVTAATAFNPGVVTVGSGALVVASADCFFGTLTGADLTDFTAGSPGDLQYVIGPATGSYAPSWSSTDTDMWAGAIAVFQAGTAASAGAATGAGQAIAGLTVANPGAAAGTGAAKVAGASGDILTVAAGAAAGAGGTSPGSFAGPSTSAAGGGFGPYAYYPQITSSADDTLVNNDVWNGGDASAWTQVLTVANPGEWSVDANITNTSGAVISYPDVEQPFYEKPLSQWTAITASWAESMGTWNPSVAMAEAAFDIWLNDYGNEVMIWVDITPLQAGTLDFDTYYGQVTISGQLLNYWHGGGASEIIYALATNQPTGTVDVLGVLRHAEANGLIPASSNLTAIEFGWEISTTGGVSQTFTMSSFTIAETFGIGIAGGSGRAARPAVHAGNPVPGIVTGVFP